MIRFNKNNKRGEITLYGTIGQSWWGESISAIEFKKQLKALGDVDEIELRINSEGGSVFDGAAIYNLLKEHRAKVFAHVDGMALSAASVVLMAGDERIMAENAFVMIHNPWSMVLGGAKDMRKEADLLDQIRSSIIDVYAARASVDKEEIGKMMDEETWLLSDDAIEKGFVDKVSENLKVAACFDATKFSHVPSWAFDRSKADEPPRDLQRRQRLAHMGKVVGTINHPKR